MRVRKKIPIDIEGIGRLIVLNPLAICLYKNIGCQIIALMHTHSPRYILDCWKFAMKDFKLFAHFIKYHWHIFKINQVFTLSAFYFLHFLCNQYGSTIRATEYKVRIIKTTGFHSRYSVSKIFK